LEFLKNQYGVELVRITLNYPIEDADVVDLTKQAIERENATGKPIRMVVVDAISSLPGVLLPFQPVLQLAKENNILSLLDGAHSIGHIDLDLHEMGPDFFVANCHKWLYTPRGCAIVYVAKRNQGYIHPTTINASYQHHDDPSDSNTFNDEHFPGTVDCSQFMVVGKGIYELLY
jgi:selenocysteine lyase/cysteine desulfurase